MVTDFLLLIIPSLAVMGGAWWAGRSDQPQGARRRLLLLLAGAVLLVALLAALIWFNPYGRSISSSLAAFGLLPVLVALFVLLLNRPAQWLGLWRSDRLLLSILLILLLVAFGWLYAAQPSTFWLVVGLTASFGVVWWLGTRPGLALPMVVGGIALVCIFLGGGGWLYLPGMLAPEWLRIGLSIAAGLSMVLCIFLAAALLYAALRNGLPLQRRHALPRLALGFFLVLGSAYYILWDGIWSSAHARAFEDHWPFAQFLFSLLAGLDGERADVLGGPASAGPLFFCAERPSPQWPPPALRVAGRRISRSRRRRSIALAPSGNQPLDDFPRPSSLRFLRPTTGSRVGSSACSRRAPRGP